MKTAIITGGTRGIGLGIAKCMARDGYNLVLGYHTNDNAAQLTQEMIEKEYGVKVICCSGDMALPDTMEKLFAAVRTHFNNEITAFIHNAGLYLGITTESTDLQPKSDDDFESIYDYYQKVYPRAFKRGIQLALTCTGLRYIIAISSPGCNCNQVPQIGYEMPGQAKASMEFLVRLYARKLAKEKITVNCVIPGYIKTEAWEKIFEKTKVPREVIETNVTNSPMARWAEPSEIGEVVAFLCSSRGEFITGVALPVDGGLHLQG
jgi:NAD(P)-dependent dehydrogenase (short-subunit alcohol dehydrogenase family)